MLWLGIDGGGTKTACSLYNDHLERLDRLVLPTCHYAQVGLHGMHDVLAQGIAWAEERAKRLDDGEGTLGVGFAICGYGEGTETASAIDQLVRDVAGAHPYVLVNDVEAAWAAGLDCADGIAIIAGTGSIALGVRDGAQIRCGGWDYELGDEGSGGWLGKELLRAFTRQADGRDPRGALYDMVREVLNLHDDFDIIAWAQAHYARRGDVAALSPIVTRAAAAGDASAQAILARAAAEEADLVRAIKAQLFDAELPGASGEVDRTAAPSPTSAQPPAAGAATHARHDTIPVTYIGGTFNAGACILEPLARALPAGCTLVEPAHEPDLGPVLILRNRLERSA